MELVSEKLTLKLDGVVYELSYPTVAQIKEMDKNKEINIDSVCKLISDCGLPMNVVENLQANHLNQITEALVSKGK